MWSRSQPRASTRHPGKQHAAVAEDDGLPHPAGWVVGVDGVGPGEVEDRADGHLVDPLQPVAEPRQGRRTQLLHEPATEPSRPRGVGTVWAVCAVQEVGGVGEVGGGDVQVHRRGGGVPPTHRQPATRSGARAEALRVGRAGAAPGGPRWWARQRHAHQGRARQRQAWRHRRRRHGAGLAAAAGLGRQAGRVGLGSGELVGSGGGLGRVRARSAGGGHRTGPGCAAGGPATPARGNGGPRPGRCPRAGASRRPGR